MSKDYGHNHIVERLRRTLFYACEIGVFESATEALKNGANPNGKYLFLKGNTRGSSLHAVSCAHINVLCLS